jgi:hypothetical protein
MHQPQRSRSVTVLLLSGGRTQVRATKLILVNGSRRLISSVFRLKSRRSRLPHQPQRGEQDSVCRKKQAGLVRRRCGLVGSACSCSLSCSPESYSPSAAKPPRPTRNAGAFGAGVTSPADPAERQPELRRRLPPDTKPVFLVWATRRPAGRRSSLPKDPLLMGNLSYPWVI